MNKTIHGTSCWECSDLCDGDKHIFCEKLLAEHDARVRADVIKVCAKEMSKLTGLCQRACPIHCEWGEAGSCEKSWEEYFLKKVKDKQR